MSKLYPQQKYLYLFCVEHSAGMLYIKIAHYFKFTCQRIMNKILGGFKTKEDQFYPTQNGQLDQQHRDISDPVVI